MIRTKTKQAFVVTGLGIVAVAMGIVILLWAFTLEIFPTNNFRSDNYVPYGLQGLQLETTDREVATGLPSSDVVFKFADTNGANSAALGEGGLSVLGTNIQKEIQEEPHIYNVRGTSVDDRYAFDFESVSPSDYVDDTYQNAYSSFNDLASGVGYSSLKYSSNIDASGHRIVTIEMESSNNGGGEVLASAWDSIIKSLPVIENTSYKVTLKTDGGVTVEGAFSTEDEKNAVATPDVAIWGNSTAYMGRFGTSTYSVEKTTVYLSGAAGTNQNTIALTVPAGTDKGTFTNDFKEKSSADPDIATPSAFTTTLTVDGEQTPFHIEYPSNRIW